MRALLACFFISYCLQAFCFDTNILSTSIKPYMQKQNVSGAAVAYYVAGDEGVVCYGVANKELHKPVTPDTIFEIASITKVFTSTDLALQVEEGHMSLQDHLTRYIPKLKGSSGPISQITLEELATHTSGLPRDFPCKEFMPFLRTWKPSYPIGSQSVYSNLGFGLLGFALENCEGRSYQEILDDEVLKPLGMKSTMISVPDVCKKNRAVGYSAQGVALAPFREMVIPASGELHSTASDMLLFLKANLDLIGPRKLRQAMKMAQEGHFTINNAFQVGLGWQRVTLDGHLVIDKNGSLPGFSSYIGMIPKQKIGVVLLMNEDTVNTIEFGRNVLLTISREQNQPR